MGNHDLSLIDKEVYDYVDDAGKSSVDFTNPLPGPDLDAPPSPPTGLTVSVDNQGVFTLNWNANPESDIAGYRVYYDVDAGYPYEGTGAAQGTSGMDVGKVTSYQLSNLPANTDIHFAVIAYDNSGDTWNGTSWFSKDITGNICPSCPTLTPTNTPTPTVPTNTPTSTISVTPSNTPTSTPTVPTDTSTHTATPTLTDKASDTPTATSTIPTFTPTATATTPTVTPTSLPPALLVLIAMQPQEGSANQVTNGIITGNGFVDTPTARLQRDNQSVELSPVTMQSATQLLVNVPANLDPGSYDLVVRNPDGTSAVLPNAFIVQSETPVILDVRPNQGSSDQPTDHQ
ncbi:MAG: fibronectin type III domain-containing protein [Caldilineaceae bacterium]